MFSTLDCGMAAIRGKEDPWNSIISGAATSGCLAIRGIIHLDPSSNKCYNN